MLPPFRITAIAVLAAAAVTAGSAGARPAPVGNEPPQGRAGTGFGSRPCQHLRYVDRTTGRVVTTRYGAACSRL